jgi:tRNA(fMet)-specific endonuclease VapC
MSSITLAELKFGAEAKRSQKLHRSIRSFIKDVAVIPFDETAADRFALVAAALARRGVPSGAFDTLLAAHALSLGLTVVTNNTKHFSRVPGLTVENWV